MSSPEHQRIFTEAAGRALADIEARTLRHDGNLMLRIHVTNARRRPNAWGVSIGKEHRESRRKIDLAVCMIGARMVRRMWEGLPEKNRRRRRTGRVIIVE
jgi:phage terminase large subunit-like protein